MAELNGRPDPPPSDGGDSRTPRHDAPTAPRDADRINRRGGNNDPAAIRAAWRASDQFAPEKLQRAVPGEQSRARPEARPPSPAQHRSERRSELRQEIRNELQAAHPAETGDEVTDLRRQLAESRAENAKLAAERQADKAEFEAAISALSKEFDARLTEVTDGFTAQLEAMRTKLEAQPRRFMQKL